MAARRSPKLSSRRKKGWSWPVNSDCSPYHFRQRMLNSFHNTGLVKRLLINPLATVRDWKDLSENNIWNIFSTKIPIFYPGFEYSLANSSFLSVKCGLFYRPPAWKADILQSSPQGFVQNIHATLSFKRALRLAAAIATIFRPRRGLFSTTIYPLWIGQRWISFHFLRDLSHYIRWNALQMKIFS